MVRLNEKRIFSLICYSLTINNILNIIVLLILAGVSIAILTGQNGILAQAQNAKTTTEIKTAEEKAKLAVMAARAQSETGELDADKLITEIITSYGGSATKTGNGFPVNATIDGKNFTIESTGVVTVTGSTTPDPESIDKISKSTSYVGYYADIDADGTPDGIIYADKAVGGSGQWGDSNGDYTIPIVTEGLKDYYISKKDFKYNDGFGTKDVISPTGTGTERFYIMALTDIDGKRNGTQYDWYNAARGYVSDYESTTSTDFGTGKTNTATMISKWNSKAYGDQDKCSSHKDMWGQIQTEVNKGWFVPSKVEWAAFAGELGIASGNYADFGLSTYYWSSYHPNAFFAWYAGFGEGCMSLTPIDGSGYVRLSATF